MLARKAEKNVAVAVVAAAATAIAVTVRTVILLS
jgi:hypothetical protein